MPQPGSTRNGIDWYGTAPPCFACVFLFVVCFFLLLFVVVCVFFLVLVSVSSGADEMIAVTC